MNVGNLMLLHDSISHLDVNYMIFESSKWCLLLSKYAVWLVGWACSVFISLSTHPLWSNQVFQIVFWNHALWQSRYVIGSKMESLSSAAGTLLAWSFTPSLNHKAMIRWGFFRLSAPKCASMAAGVVSLKKLHHIITLWFSEVVKDHAIYTTTNNTGVQINNLSRGPRTKFCKVLCLLTHQLGR